MSIILKKSFFNQIVIVLLNSKPNEMTIKIYYELMIGLNMDIENAPLEAFLTIAYMDSNFIYYEHKFDVNQNKNFTKRYISKLIKIEIQKFKNLRLKIIEKPESKFSIFKYVLLG